MIRNIGGKTDQSQITQATALVCKVICNCHYTTTTPPKNTMLLPEQTTNNHRQAEKDEEQVSHSTSCTQLNPTSLSQEDIPQTVTNDNNWINYDVQSDESTEKYNL